MVRWPSLRPDASTATAVWLRLCASIPTITMVVSPFFSWGDNDRPGGHLSVAAMPRSYQATPVPVDHVTSRTTGRSHEGGRMWWSEPATPPARDTDGSGVRSGLRVPVTCSSGAPILGWTYAVMTAMVTSGSVGFGSVILVRRL